MSISLEISRIQSDKTTIRNKLVELGMATSTANLDALALAIDGIVNRGSVSATVQEGTTYTIPAGYHNGSGTVSGVGGGGNYSLQSKSVTPTKASISVTNDSGYYGLSDVTVAAIPDAYQDVTSVTATAGDVLTGKVYVAADGTITTGTMSNRGKVTQTLNTTTISYTIPKGFHDGTGTVKITLDTQSVTPTKSQQTITPSTGTVLSSVTVNAIPDEYITTGDADATDADILADKTAYVNGAKVTGAMTNNGAVTATLNTTTKSYTVPAGYHNGKGTVSITTETKSTTPTKAQQTISATTGKVLSSVTVNAIPAAYQDVTGVTAAAGDVLTGKKIVSSTGATINGSMPNNGSVSATFDGLTDATSSATVPAGYTTGGTISLTGDIEEALAAI